MIPLKNYLFSKFRGPYFIETGTSVGGGVRLALECGYGCINSIENDLRVFESTCDQFDDPRVTLWHGDSATTLQAILKRQFEPVVFWLDAHDVEKGTCAVLRELDAIAKSRIVQVSNTTIMIDDWEDFGTPKHGNISKQQVIDAIRKIDPSYRIACYYAEPGAPNVLVATI